MPSFQDCLASARAESNAENDMSLLGPPLEHPSKINAANKVGIENNRAFFAANGTASFLRIIWRLLIERVKPSGVRVPRDLKMRLVIAVPATAPALFVGISDVVSPRTFYVAI